MVLCLLGNGTFQLEKPTLCISHPLSYIRGCLVWVTMEVSSGLPVSTWEKGRELANFWENGGPTLMWMPFTSSAGAARRRQPRTKAGIVWEVDPFHKPSKPPFQKAWQGFSFGHGWTPSMAIIYYCQTVCCLYLPRLTNWTFVGLATPLENQGYCDLLYESFCSKCQKPDPSCSLFPFPVQVALFLPSVICFCFILSALI